MAGTAAGTDRKRHFTVASATSSISERQAERRLRGDLAKRADFVLEFVPRVRLRGVLSRPLIHQCLHAGDGLLHDGNIRVCSFHFCLAFIDWTGMIDWVLPITSMPFRS